LKGSDEMGCPYCGTKGLGWATLMKHCQSDHPDKFTRAAGEYCLFPECPKLPAFATRELLQEHEKVCHPERESNVV